MKNKKTYTILLLAFLIIFLGTGLILMLNKTYKQEINYSAYPQKPIPTIAPKKGFFKLVTVDNLSRYPVNKPLTLNLVADSEREDIVGWDLLVSFDPAEFNFVKATSTVTDYKIYPYKRDNYVILTGIKSLQSEEPSVYNGDIVATVTFLPIKTGNLTLKLTDKMNNEKTDMVNSVTKQIYPQLSKLSLKIY